MFDKIKPLLIFEPALFIASFVGALTGARREKLSPWKRFLTIATGTVFTAITTPFVVELLNLTNDQSKYGVAATLGYLGINTIERIVKRKIGEDEVS